MRNFRPEVSKPGKTKKAILGTKLGMTQIFSPQGLRVPVTVVQAGPCPVVAVKTAEKDGYNALILGFGEIRPKLVGKPLTGTFKKAGVKPKRHLREVRYTNLDAFFASALPSFEGEKNAQALVGKEVKADIFVAGETIDVIGTTRGRGYTGRVYRWNMHRGPETHGSKHHRQTGSTGSNSTPSRVWKGKRMPGQYGVERVTIQNLEVVKVDIERNVLLIKGGIPGPKNALVYVRNAVKGQKRKKVPPPPKKGKMN